MLLFSFQPDYLVCGHWTACEHLILLETDSKELRDYSVLLYHSGFYEESLQYLKLYQESEVNYFNLANQSMTSLYWQVYSVGSIAEIFHGENIIRSL